MIDKEHKGIERRIETTLTTRLIFAKMVL